MADNPLLAAPKAPASPTGGPPGAEIGVQSQQINGGGGWQSFVDEGEYVPSLSFPQSIETYHRMRSDSQVDALHSGTVQPIKEFRWSIDPNNAPAKLVEQAARDLGLPVYKHEDDPIPRGPKTLDFQSVLDDALLSPLYGFWHFEIVGENREGENHLQRLSPRHPRTIAEFQSFANGDLAAIRQNIAPLREGRFFQPEPIPAWKLLTFVYRAEAGSHLGRSLLRSMYREWLVKDRVLRIAAINLERAGGVPVVESAMGASNKQIEENAVLARQFKVAEGGGGALPFGSKLTLVGGSVPDAISFLKYLDECLARVWALMLVQLGTTATGNRALGAEFAIYAARFQRSLGTWIKTQFDKLLDAYVEWNEPFATHAPMLRFDNPKPDGMSVTDLVSMVSAGLIVADPELEEWIRNEGGLPEAPPRPSTPELGDLTPAEVALVQNARNPSEPGQAEKPSTALDPISTAPTLARAGGTTLEREHRGIRAALTLPDREMRRLPSANEIRAAVDYRALDQAHSWALVSLQDSFMRDVVPEQIKALGDQIRFTKAGDPRKVLTRTALAKIQAPVQGIELLKGHLLTAAISGANAAVKEAQAQGVTGASAPAEDALAARVADQAAAVAGLSANGISLSAQTKAASLVTGRTPDQVAGKVESHLSGLKNAWTLERLKGAVTMAQNQGRIASFVEIGGEPTFEASELLDENTCEACEAIDGTEFGDLAEGEEAYAAGGYVECYGGPNCRGILVAVYPEQNPEVGTGPLGEAEPPVLGED